MSDITDAPAVEKTPTLFNETPMHPVLTWPVVRVYDKYGIVAVEGHDSLMCYGVNTPKCNDYGWVRIEWGAINLLGKPTRTLSGGDALQYLLDHCL